MSRMCPAVNVVTDVATLGTVAATCVRARVCARSLRSAHQCERTFYKPVFDYKSPPAETEWSY